MGLHGKARHSLDRRRCRCRGSSCGCRRLLRRQLRRRLSRLRLLLWLSSLRDCWQRRRPYIAGDELRHLLHRLLCWLLHWLCRRLWLLWLLLLLLWSLWVRCGCGCGCRHRHRRRQACDWKHN